MFKSFPFKKSNPPDSGERRKSKRFTSMDSIGSSMRATRKGRGKNNESSHTEEQQNTEKMYLLERIGGAHVLSCVVDDFLETVGHDNQLNYFFQNTDIKHLATHQKRLLSMAFTKIPEGISVDRTIYGHHKHLFEQGLNEKHFDLVAQHLIASMVFNGISHENIQEAVDIIAPLRAIFEEGAKEAKQQFKHQGVDLTAVQDKRGHSSKLGASRQTHGPRAA